jgi:hypothetical protein
MARSMPKFGLEEIYNSVGRNPGQNGKLTGETTLIRTNSWGNCAGFWFSWTVRMPNLVVFDRDLRFPRNHVRQIRKDSDYIGVVAQ